MTRNAPAEQPFVADRLGIHKYRVFGEERTQQTRS
jgi:hypothetical protein